MTQEVEALSRWRRQRQVGLLVLLPETKQFGPLAEKSKLS
jgi:hypothetical protein